MSLAIITGASSGMGLATVELFLDRGWTVVAVDVAPVPVSSPNLIELRASVTDRASLEQGLRELIPGKTVDVVANIAGIYPPTTLETFTEEIYRKVFDVNVLGVMNVTAAALPFMDKGSSVVNFASVDAFTVSRGQLVYGASKAAVVMLTKEMALELAGRGIRVNGIAPGWVDTPGNAATGRMAEAAASIPLGRVAQPREIAEWVLTISGSIGGFMTGETIVLSGGDVLR
jgi:3-oxoacyl-[acyl-carrier protein] reductase